MKLIDCFYKSPNFSGKHTSYFDTYEEILSPFRNKEITLVEVGINNGGSLFMWKEFLGNKCRVIGIDNNPKCKQLQNDGFDIHIGNQADPAFWKDFFLKVGKIDILIDDGGHTNLQQAVTINSAVENINDDGLIIVEDTHTSYLKKYGNPSKYSFKNLIFQYIDRINYRSESLDNNKSLSLPIASIYFFESTVCLKINRKMNKISNQITNNKKILNIEENKFAIDGKDNFNNFISKFKFLENVPFLGKLLKKITKQVIIPFILKNRIKIQSKKMKKFFINLSK